MSATPVATFPVAILMARKMIQRGRWSAPHWEALGVVSGQQFKDAQRSRELVHEAEGLQHFLYRGFTLQLYRDTAETYWWNLTAAQPSLFVICLKDSDDELVPNQVTADHEAAQAAVEKDGAAFAVPIPADIHEELERVVVTYYKPEPHRKRKQHQWSKEDEQ